ncbi:Protein kinase domain-containing protein [Mycena sanguinolenta]|uniref:Protein kinase domain-containing protein n=1 Tax=Mycena sanguinolenta TaxID=230812 RepID=A0A8H6YN68_9AGAR|nr:Protein kinase domain-containing protein [Mycena sanguinolenta]
MSDSELSAPPSFLTIRPDELLIEDEPQIVGTQIAQGRWRNKIVILKILSEQAEPSALQARGQVWTTLRHPNVHEVFGISSLDADPLYVVTEFQENGNVNSFLQQNPEADRAKIVFDVALGMQYLHRCGVAHGSLKPTNILVKADGQVCITDYGIIELQTTGSNGHRYFSPEAWKGTISRASDVFAWAMCALEIFTSKPPWGILSERQIFRLVVQQDTKPERPDEDFGLTDHVWDVMEKCWQRDSRRRPSFDILVQLLQAPACRRQSGAMLARASTVPAPRARIEGNPFGALAREHFPSDFALRSPVPPAYESAHHPDSAPATISLFRDSNNPSDLSIPIYKRALPAPPSLHRLASASARTSSSVGRSTESFTRRLGQTEYSESTMSLPAASSVFTSTSNTTVIPNAAIIVGALVSEVNADRKPETIDTLLLSVQELGLKSDKEAQQLVAAGAISPLVVLLKARAAADGVGLEIVLMTLGILIHDSVTANMIYRNNNIAVLIEVVSAAHADSVTALAIWSLSRICRTTEIVNGLLKQTRNLGKLLVAKGLRATAWSTARAAAWCIGALVRSDPIADILADIGMAPALCEYLQRCKSSNLNADTTAEDYSAGFYAVARLSRSVKIAKALAKGGCVEILGECLHTTEDPDVLLWSARAVGCLMRPNSSDMAKILLDAGVARGLARLPGILPAEEVKPLGAFAFAVQRFSCAEWGGGTRKALVDAGVVDALLAALACPVDPEVHIDLANAISLLSDVGGGVVRREITNAGGIEILKRVGRLAGRVDVVKACNQAATSIVGNVWTRNSASAKAALAHQWSGGCPDYFSRCPIAMQE